MKSHKMMASYTNVFVSNTNVPPLMTFSFVLMHSVGFEIHHFGIYSAILQFPYHSYPRNTKWQAKK